MLKSLWNNSIWPFLTRDIISSCGHAFLTVSVILLVYFGGVWTAYWAMVAFYTQKEVRDIRKHWKEEGAFTQGFKLWVGDGWLDLMFPVVFGAVAARLLT